MAGLSAGLLALAEVVAPAVEEWGDPPSPTMALCPRLRTTYSPRSTWWNPEPRTDPAYVTDLAWVCGTGFLKVPGATDQSGGEGAPPPLGLSLAHNSEKRARYGIHGIRSAARRQVWRALALLEERRWALGMHTVTLPGPALDQLAAHDAWPAFQERYRHELRRQLLARGLPDLVVGVVELQPARSAAENRPCPHLHTVFVGRNRRSGAWAISPADFDRIIAVALASAGVHGVNLAGAGQVVPIKRSVRAYLACYMTKEQVDPAPWVGGVWEALIPRQWWFWTRTMRDWVLQHILPLALPFMAWVHEHRHELVDKGWIAHREVKLPDPRAPLTWEVNWLDLESFAGLFAFWLEDEWDAEWGRNQRRQAARQCQP